LEDIREFELPWWISLEDDEDEDRGSGPPQTQPVDITLLAPGLTVTGDSGRGGRHPKGQSRADGGDVEFRRFLDDTQQDSEKVAASALLQL